MTEDRFDVAPFALPNCPSGEIRFEAPRDIVAVTVVFLHTSWGRAGLSYLRKVWPEHRFENVSDTDNPCSFGWQPTDDWFNCRWQKARTTARRTERGGVTFTFKPLTAEMPDMDTCDVRFRRTLGIRIDVSDPGTIRRICVYTRSPRRRRALVVELDAGRKTVGAPLEVEAYNAHVLKSVRGARRLRFVLDCMEPAHRYANDDALVTFRAGRNVFTVSVAALDAEGPVWYAERGIFVKDEEDPVTFEDYRRRVGEQRTIADRVARAPEQSFAGASNGQPRPHPVSTNLGIKQSRQRFTIEANGDVVLKRWNVMSIRGKDTPRFKNKGSARFFFGLERWYAVQRCADPSPVLSYRMQARKRAIAVEQHSVAVPLFGSMGKGDTSSDAPVVLLVRFRFRNEGDAPGQAALPVRYSSDSMHSQNPYGAGAERQDDSLVPRSSTDRLRVRAGRILGHWGNGEVVRCAVDTAMRSTIDTHGIIFRKGLAPGESCDLVLKIAYIALESTDELASLKRMSFDRCYRQAARFWRAESGKGAQLRVPEPHLEELHAAHVAHVQITDAEMPDGSGLINTSVGTSTYGNFSNESCMIVQELDQRGLHEDARRRLELWIKYQGTAVQPGNFTDYDGMYFGAGGYECGAYNQHHGWVLWCLCEHLFYTRDTRWFRGVAGSVVAGADWVFRQRRNTMRDLPHSRGWERGFLPAGSLEDVTDFYYWLSTNALTWRGVDNAARALETVGHPEAARVRREADAYRRDLVRGFDTARKHAPLVRLGDGRWVPHYPSRLYCRGRDYGWIREVLEGAVYLLISGLVDSNSRKASWILDDYQDNRYVRPPFGYGIEDFRNNWFDRGGFSIQPNLLAGIMPYLDRDEPELAVWTFFNAWCACYREEIGAMVEHPMPVLGYSNTAQFKTSDQANAVMWLRYLLVYWNHELLHLGRALPRAWLAAGEEISLTRLSTYFGRVDVFYTPELQDGRIVAELRAERAKEAGRILVRFRHPERRPIRAVFVNGKRWTRVDAKREDVDVTGLSGRIWIEVRY